MSKIEYTPCGGCGATSPDQRCMGCLHNFGAGSWNPSTTISASPSDAERYERAVSDGWQLVPKQPTKEMAYKAACAHYGVGRVNAVGGIEGISMTVDSIDYNFQRAFRRFWKGALAASPAAPPPPAAVHEPVAVKASYVEGWNDAKGADRDMTVEEGWYFSDANISAASSTVTDPAPEIARLRSALEFYADVSKYPSPLTGGLGDLYFDCGEIARTTLLQDSSVPESKPLSLDITKEWFEKRAALEGDLEIGAGGRRLTNTINLSADELAELERLVNIAAPEIAALRADNERLRKALGALDNAVEASIRKNDEPHRVIFRDGFVLEGRAADEWHQFMMLIRKVARAAVAPEQEEAGE